MPRPPLKIWNEFRASLNLERQQVRISNRPLYIFLEVTNRCNLACVMCGRTHDRRYRDPNFSGDMSLETVGKLDRFYGPSTFVTATGLGEPFLHPQMVEILTHLKKRKAVVSLTTNGMLVGPETAERLVEARVDRLVCSIDSPDEKNFKRIRVGGDLATILKNLDHLSRLRSKRRSKYPHLILEFVAMAQNFHELPEMADLAARLGFDEIIVQNLFKALDPGYLSFYDKNRLASIEPEKVLEIWRDFMHRVRHHDLILYSPFSRGGIHEYLGDKETSSPKPRRLKTAGGILGFLDSPAEMENVGSKCHVSGWILGRKGVPRIELCVDNATQSLHFPLQTGHLRPDVLPVLPEDFPQEPNCGFSQTVDFSEVAPGISTVFLRVWEGEGQTPGTVGRRQISIGSESSRRMYCTQPWSTLYVTWDGKIRTCCFNELTLGDLANQTAAEVWNGENYRNLREKVVRGEVVADCWPCLAGKSNPNYIRPLRQWLPWEKPRS